MQGARLACLRQMGGIIDGTIGYRAITEKETWPKRRARDRLSRMPPMAHDQDGEYSSIFYVGEVAASLRAVPDTRPLAE